jgi:acid phosphatase type 7
MHHLRPPVGSRSYRWYRLIVLGLLVVVMALPLDGDAGPVWGNQGDIRVTDTTLPTDALGLQSEHRGLDVVAAASRECKSIKNKKRRKRCRQEPASAVLLAAGDIASCSSNGDEATAALLATHPGTVAALGDLVYSAGSSEAFVQCYEPSWGLYKDRTRPALGNHEYGSSGAAGYFRYFGSAATPLEPECRSACRGYYSYDLSAWHIVVLNSNCVQIGGCSVGSPQERWLRADLAAHPATCTLAYWHHPRFSSGSVSGSNDFMQPIWQAFSDLGGDVVLSGHEHSYERFAPLDANGTRDDARGIREFVVGTGGKDFQGLSTPLPTSEVRNRDTFGILQLTLRPTSYAWRFLPIAGQSFTDTGSGACH